MVIGYRLVGPLDACLDALAAQRGDIDFEIIVVLNGATPEVAAAIEARQEPIRVVRNSTNLGFAGGCNRGAAAAAGDHLVFLNDDALPEPDWLERLVAFADGHPRAGAVASLVLFPDGTVQEAGGVVWREGNTTPVARGERADHIDATSARQIDYGSACALLVRRQAFAELGGFDGRYFPAYYEDVDLCLSLRERGWEVWFAPEARVVHLESASSPHATKYESFLANEERFRAKWRDVLPNHQPRCDDVQAALPRAVSMARGGGLRVLIIDDMAPKAGMGAGYDRMLDVIQALLRRRVRVALHPTAAPGGSELAGLGVEIIDDLDHLLAAECTVFDAVVASRPNNVAAALRVRVCQPWAAVIYDAEALFFRRFERWADFAGEDAAAARATAEDWRSLERSAATAVDTVVTISADEQAWFLDAGATCPVQLVPPLPERLHVDAAGFGARRGAIFVSGWLAGAQSPNAHGLRWFATDVLPRLRLRLPWVDIAVTGANPPAGVVETVSSALRFVGHVDDLAALYGQARVAIAPLLWGSGVKLKTIGALAHGIPVVSTEIGAEGIPEAWRRHVDVADDPGAFADRLALLLSDRTAWESRRAGIDAMLEAHQFDLGETWTGIIDEAIDHRSRAGQLVGVGSSA